MLAGPPGIVNNEQTNPACNNLWPQDLINCLSACVYFGARGNLWDVVATQCRTCPCRWHDSTTFTKINPRLGIEVSVLYLPALRETTNLNVGPTYGLRHDRGRQCCWVNYRIRGTSIFTRCLTTPFKQPTLSRQRQSTVSAFKAHLASNRKLV